MGPGDQSQREGLTDWYGHWIPGPDRVGPFPEIEIMTRLVFAPVLVLVGAGLQSASLSAHELPEGNSPATFWHLGIVVRDMERMDAFYTKVIGLEQVTDLLVTDTRVEEASEEAIRVQELDGLMGIEKTRIIIRHYSDPRHTQFLELMLYPDHPAEQVERAANLPLGWNHLGITVDDLDRVLNAIDAGQGGEVIGGPSVLPEFGSKRYAFIKDPEGNLVELVQGP